MKTKKRQTAPQSTIEILGTAIYRLTQPDLIQIGHRLGGWFDSDDPDDVQDEAAIVTIMMSDPQTQKQVADFAKPSAAKLIGLKPNQFELRFWAEKSNLWREVTSVEFKIIPK